MRMPKLKATDSLEAAKALFAAEKFDACASRAYYAVYQASWHCFDRLGLPPDEKTDDGEAYWAHRRLKKSVAIHLHFDPEQQEKIEILYSRRIAADYASIHVDPFEANECCELADEILTLLLGNHDGSDES
jgi:hypothetical protein